MNLLPKIPPRTSSSSKGKQVARTLSSQGTSASQSSQKRQTQNSIRAGLLTSPASSSRDPSRDPSVQRVEQRIRASLDQQATRQRTRNTNLDLPHITPPESPLTNISEMSPTGTSTSAVAGSSAGTGGTQNPGAGQARSAPMPTRKMPKPGEKNAPTFDPEKPEELGRFFERMEDWFADEYIVDDTDKKKRIVRYLDPDSESQWKALSKFDTGTFAEFQDQVMASYPKAEEIKKGSVTALKRKIREIGPVAPNERDELLGLIRIMQAEVRKLTQIQPPIHTNRELVDLFLARLTVDFAGIIANKLSVQRLVAQANNVRARNTEDMYDIDEVMDAAKEASLEYANPFGKYLGTVSGPASQASIKLEAAVAQIQDSMEVQAKQYKTVDQRLASLQNSMSQPRPPQAAQAGFNRGLVPSTNQMAPNIMIKCYYCQGPHRIAECEHALKHLDLGWIVRNNGQMRLPDGQFIPRDGMKTMKEVIEDIKKPKPGIIPMSKIQDKAALYQDAQRSSYVQTQSSDDADLRTLTELIQKVGIDRLQAMISAPAEELTMEEPSDWNQNFDQVQ